MSLKRPAAGGESCKQDSLLRILFFLIAEMQKPAVSVNQNRHDHGAVDRCHETLSGKWTADQRQHQSGGVKADQ